MTAATMDQKLEEMRLENERKRLDIAHTALTGLLIIAGAAAGAVVLAYIIVQGMDTELVDALQECGLVRIEQPGPNPSPINNASVDQCRDKVFEHFKGASQ